MSERPTFTPHRHSDELGLPWREGAVAICGCEKVVKAIVAWGQIYWRDVLWPWSAWWRRKLQRGGMK